MTAYRQGHRWKDLPIFTRPLRLEDLLPLGAALLAGAAAWEAACWLRRRGDSAPARKTAAAVGVLCGGIGLSLCIFMLLGMDETFVKVLLPAPHPPVGYASEITLGGLFVVGLALFGLLDPELPPALGALFPGWFLAFAWMERVPGFSHLLAAIPGLSLGYSFYHVYVLPPICAFWTAWGLERLWRLRLRPWTERLRPAVLFSAVALLLTASVFGALYWQNSLRLALVGTVDLGLSPGYLEGANGEPVAGFMGVARQGKLYPVNPITGWYAKALPVTAVNTGMLGVATVPTNGNPIGDRFYFKYLMGNSGIPTAEFVMPDGRREIQAPRIEVLPVSRQDVAVARALGPAALAAIVAALFIGGGAWPAFVVGTCALAEMLLMTVFYVPSIPRESVFPKNTATERLAEDRSLFRIYSEVPGLLVMPPISGSVFGLEDFRSDINVSSRRAEAFRAIVEDSLTGSSPLSRDGAWSLLDLANVKYHFAVSSDTQTAGRFELVTASSFVTPRPQPQSEPYPQDAFMKESELNSGLVRDPALESVQGSFRLWRSKRVKPRAMVFEEAITIPLSEFDTAAAERERTGPVRSWLASQRGDFTRTLLLHDDSLRWATPPRRAAPAAPREATIAGYEPGRVEVDADAPRGGWLFLSDTYFPGWRATVDGRERPIAPAWVAFRAVGLEPGRHRVVFEYRPRSFRVGLLLSALGWGVWMWIFYRLAWRAGQGFVAAPGEWVIEGTVLACSAWWLAWTAYHLLR